MLICYNMCQFKGLVEVKKKKNDIINYVDLRTDEEVYKENKSFLTRLGSCCLAAVLAISASYINSKNYRRTTHRPIYDAILDFRNVELESIKETIHSSKRLTDEEKDFLYNPQFFEDVLPYINSSEIGKFLFDLELDKVNIKVYDDSDSYGKNFGGYYLSLDGSIHINIKYINSSKYDILAHEFLHLCQRTNKYNLIYEACAEILSHEYYDVPCSSYSTEVYLVKKLMETIGPEPIKEFIFTGFFDSAEEELRKYFSNQEYNQFISLLNMKNVANPFYNKEQEDNNRGKLNEMIDMLYERKFGYPSNYDPAIACLNNPNTHFERYYFNTSKMDQGNYFDYYEIKSIPIKEAFDANLVQSVFKEEETYYVGYANYDQLKDNVFSKDDVLKCSYMNSSSPVHIGVYDDGSLFAYTKTHKIKTVPPINKKFETDKIKTLKLY